jgi:hypothetical protein
MMSHGLRSGAAFLSAVLVSVAAVGVCRGALAQAAGKKTANAAAEKPIPNLSTLMQQVEAHQKELEAIRENYTYREETVTETLNSHGKVVKTESEQDEVFFVNGHEIDRTVEKNGKPLSGHDADKEQERVNKLVAKAQQTPQGQSLQHPNQTITVAQMLDVMQVSNPRRVNYNGRSTLEFDVAGRHDAKTHGMAEGALKKIAGSIWIDEQDRQVAHLEIRFMDNFHVAGGLLANISKGSEFRFDQGLVNGEIWLPLSSEGHLEGRALMLMGFRLHITVRDWDYKRFHVDAEQEKTTSSKPDPRR